MDDQNKNLILATVLSFLVILGWFWFFPPPEPMPEAEPRSAMPSIVASIFSIRAIWAAPGSAGLRS